MEESKVIEGNILILESPFITDGMKLTIEKGRKQAAKYKKDFDIRDLAINCKYHSSWDWLMPVVEKINEICSKNGRELSNHSRDQEHLENPLDNPLHWKSWSYHYIHLSTDIKYVYEQVTKTLQWYNTSSNPKQ